MIQWYNWYKFWNEGSILYRPITTEKYIDRMTGMQFYDVISYKYKYKWVIQLSDYQLGCQVVCPNEADEAPVRPSWRPSSRLSSASQFYTSLRLVDRICFFSKYFMMSSTYLSWSLMTKVKIFEANFAFRLNMVYLWLKSQKKSDIEIRSRN